MRDTLPGLPLLHDGDSYIIWLVDVGTKMLRIVGIHKYANNRNTEAEELTFYDLDDFGRAAVIRQILRKYKGKGIIPK